MWCKPKYSVCDKCQVHFEPALGYEKRWSHLCPVHRKPVMEKDLRKEAVIMWASFNWEKLEPQYLAEREASGQLSQEAIAAMAQSQGHMQSGSYDGLGLQSTLSSGLGMQNANRRT